MRETRRPGNYPCQRILRTLKMSLRAIFIISRISINESTANKSSCNSFGNDKDKGHEYDKSSNDKFEK